MKDFIQNSDTTFAYNRKATSYQLLVNRTYFSDSFGVSGQHLGRTLRAIADLSLDGTGITIIYVKASLTNCAGQKEESGLIEVILTRG